MLHLILIGHNHLIIFLRIDIATLTHLFCLRRTPTWLHAQMLVHLSLQYLELVKLGFGCHTETTVTICPACKAGPEVRKLIDDRGIVFYSRPQVAGTVVQQCPVEYRQDIVWLHFYDIVEIYYRTVVVAELHAEQSTVVASHEIVRIYFYGFVIIGHRSTQIVQIITRKSTIDIIGNALRL